MPQGSWEHAPDEVQSMPQTRLWRIFLDTTPRPGVAFHSVGLTFTRARPPDEKKGATAFTRSRPQENYQCNLDQPLVNNQGRVLPGACFRRT